MRLIKKSIRSNSYCESLRTLEAIAHDIGLHLLTRIQKLAQRLRILGVYELSYFYMRISLCIMLGASSLLNWYAKPPDVKNGMCSSRTTVERAAVGVLGGGGFESRSIGFTALQLSSQVFAH